MSGDKLPPPAHDCPRCGRSRIVQGKRHCDSATCTWVKCPCLATYDMFAFLAMGGVIFLAAAAGCWISDRMPAVPAPADFEGDDDA